MAAGPYRGGTLILNFADTETSGFEAAKGHRLVEVCFILHDADSRREIGRYLQRINPMRSIPEDATKVHGITLDDLKACPTWEQVAPKIAKIIAKTDMLICHNLDFDSQFLFHELTRVGETIPPSVGGFCSMENARWATANGKNPSLRELCWSLSVPYDPAKAHAAEYDVECLRDCYFKALDLGFFKHD